MVELGHTNYFTTEHGYQGNLFDVLNAIEKKNKELPEDKHIRMIVGSELYYVKDINSEEKDRGNYHLIMIARNNKGVEQLNEILSYANIDGYYYKPRVDRAMIEKCIDPKDVIVTSACVAGIGAEWCPYAEDNIKWFKEYFGDNFYLEVQSHNHPTQIKHNVRMKNFSSMYDIQLIHANDSHYIMPEDSVYRDLFLKGKGLNYPEEDGFVLDYPDYQDIVKRYDEQGIFTNSQILKIIDNTLIFDKCEDITIYNKEIKMPKISENPNKELKELINKLWVKERDNIPKELRGEYLKAIREETKIIEDTYMEEYFLLNNKICNVARDKYNAFISSTGRGSAGSFYLNKLLGLIGMDRIVSPVTLYPTRFMSISRILETKSLPDVDLNTSNQELLIKASEDVIGEENCGWMITYKPLQESSAFRLWCKAHDMKFDEYNEVAKELDEYKSHPKWDREQLYKVY
nr:MAG TPA: DNA-directed DNA polymerase [Caudoviricetes sp.]